MRPLPQLKALRERAFLTQAGLAQKSGVAETTINRIEQGHNEARFSTIRRLAEALGVEPSELTEGEIDKGQGEGPQE